VPRRTVAEDAEAIADLAAEQDATVLVVGLPVTLAGHEGPAAAAVRAYLAELAPLLPGLAVELADERLSTVAAERALVGGGVRRRSRRAVVDQLAASVFLQTWLDRARAGEGEQA
jgi:putative holliday junction resolvase